ncbi:hypothetical protein [Pontibacter chitinilyticus]|uniref:hypothetical protein n=1 Tax=Pontibacter chitinilyticus TaxID=2674989 RepID=UPI003219CC8F
MKIMIKKIAYLTFLSVIFSSCSSEKKDNRLLSALTEGGIKHWDLIKDNWYYPSYGKSFNVNGSYKDFIYNKQNQKCLYKGASDVVIPNTWSIQGDSLIILGNGRFRAKKISKDLLILSYVHNPKINIILVKSEKQSDSVQECN